MNNAMQISQQNTERSSEMTFTTDPGSGGKYFSSNSKTTDNEFV